MVFQGTALLALDEKGRLSLPKKQREALCAACAGSLTLTRHPDGCLLVYPTSAWIPVRDRLVALPYAARAMQRIILGSATEVSIDRAGRILIPAELRELAGLTRDVTLIGLGEKFELWDRRRYAESEAAALEAGLSAMADSFQL